MLLCYVGETGHNAYTLGLKHMAHFKGKHTDSPLWKHAQMAHGGSLEVSNYMKVEQYLFVSLMCQVNKAVRIAKCESNTQLNFKAIH